MDMALPGLVGGRSGDASPRAWPRGPGATTLAIEEGAVVETQSGRRGRRHLAAALREHFAEESIPHFDHEGRDELEEMVRPRVLLR